MRFIIERIDDIVEVLLLPHKDGSGYTYVNLTKGHICPCKFSSIEDAINDMENNPKVKSYKQIEGGV
jgi:hypothetical protein